MESLSSQTYDQLWTEATDFMSFHPGTRHRRRLILQILDSIEYKSLLDVGCGNAEMLNFLANEIDAGVKLSGVDFSSQTIESNKKRYPHISFKTYDLLGNDAPGFKADLVICSEVIEHLPDPYSAIPKLAQMVNSNGYLLLTFPLGKVYATEKHWGHTVHPEAEKVLIEVQKAQLKPKQILKWGWPVYTLQKELTNINPEAAIKSFGNGSYGPIQKLISNALYFANFLNFVDSKNGTQFIGLFSKD